jgi:hypothetical protein
VIVGCCRVGFSSVWRLRKMTMGEKYNSVFGVGWDAEITTTVGNYIS